MRAVALAALVALQAGDAHAQSECRVVQTTFKPAERLQLVVWLEDAAGNFVDTLFVTDAVGRRGLGNRPGRFDFNSGPMWPYGRRITTFPVWAHRHGDTYPLLVFQDEDDDNLSHSFLESSTEEHFCRPMRSDEPQWDAGTCATNLTFTDKGKLDATRTSLYPPREDIGYIVDIDDVAVQMFEAMNALDMVTGATPAADVPSTVTWPMPPDLPAGDYVLWIEVAKEFDHNATYSPTAYPAPFGIPFAEFGEPYRGQPSVLYNVPFTIGTSPVTAMSSAYVGYGDPDGLDGAVRAPDATIDTERPGSGAARLLLHTDGGDMFRVKVVARPELDLGPPGAASELQVAQVDGQRARVTFVAPGEDGEAGTVSGYELRFSASGPITEASFADAPPIVTPLEPDEPGQVQVFDLTGLLPETTYHVAVRAFDDCRIVGPIATVSFRTPDRAAGEVDACFVATAAYGSSLATEVASLRGFRDRVLRQSVLGELFVESYYTLGPAFSTTIDHSDVLRQAARAQLAPLVALVRDATSR
ncbi:MAG: fibronectin type III domain-containing protein [Deltaproteobacteria bacterium]|nr:fibronectin type III domain-containing protein [Kofleriaceae bacterium]